ncbi:MAG: AbrB/MazE/SpoVT family DNA-binding domain-containing protein, partial [Snowella sp.]|nr:AbrB/MazE/SpoVT family DNA-binding domain-containing protein [Snowella sp.]
VAIAWSVSGRKVKLLMDLNQLVFVHAEICRCYNVVTIDFINFTQNVDMVKARIVKVGNSQGIRIPKPLLEQSGIKTNVDIGVQGEALIIRNAATPRQDWGAAFEAMAAQGDDRLLDAPTVTDWEEAEWDWS